MLTLGVGCYNGETRVALCSRIRAWGSYGGIVSVGIGFTLQVAGQKYAKASHAAIIMQFEAVFAVLAGMLVSGSGQSGSR